ncbi:ULP-PROTEASE domain-containing protein [Aphelenchoides besseyi]|nr:ULP-PROTEASE domain-containing protein [Aphelenchoides besseyi]
MMILVVAGTVVAVGIGLCAFDGVVFKGRCSRRLRKWIRCCINRLRGTPYETTEEQTADQVIDVIRNRQPAEERPAPRYKPLSFPSTSSAEHLYKLKLESQLKDAEALHFRSEANDLDDLVDEVKGKLRVEGRPFGVVHVPGVEEFPVLSEEATKIYKDACDATKDVNEVLVTEFNLPITRKDLQTLRPTSWLNDEVINFYFSLIVERSKTIEKLPTVYAFSTYFFTALTKPHSKSRIHRWTKDVNLFEYDLVFVPLHLGAHWCLAMVDNKTRQLRFFNSMNRNGQEYLELIHDFLQKESTAKYESKYTVDDYELIELEPCPKQMNGFDCGVFTCRFAEYLSRRAPFNFHQRHMSYYRKRMVFEIVKKKLL